MKGGHANPVCSNIAVVLDTTSSMTGADDGANNTSNCTTQIGCAELGIQTLLLELYPCQGGGTCTNTSTPIDQVALYVFPGGINTTMKNDYACNGSNPTIVPYTFTNVTPGSQNLNLPAGDNYLVWGFSPNYKNSNAATTLNQGNNLVMAVGGKSGCGAGAPGGEGTYYAQVIYQAQADLTTQSNSNGNKNMMIILSDGDATACNKTLATSGGTSTDEHLRWFRCEARSLLPLDFERNRYQDHQPDGPLRLYCRHCRHHVQRLSLTQLSFRAWVECVTKEQWRPHNTQGRRGRRCTPSDMAPSHRALHA